MAVHKRQRQVSGAQAPQVGQQPAQAAHGVVRRPQAVAPVAQGHAAHAPLDPPTIRSLQDRIRGLLPPRLAAFSCAFRRAFQVPSEIPTIAELITQQRHELWIQRYLSHTQGQAQGQGQLQARTA